MATTAARAGARANAWRPARWTLWLLILAAALLTIALVAVIATPWAIERWALPTLNSHLQGYEIEAGASRLSPWRGAVVMHDVSVVQHANPEAPVARVPRLVAGLDWRGLLSGHLALAARVEGPQMTLAPQHVAAEFNDDRLLFDKGWVEAVRAVSPLAINRVRVIDAALSFEPGDGAPALRVSHVAVEATDLARGGAAGTFPSPVHITATVFGRGSVQLDGHANVSDPSRPAVDTALLLRDVPVGALHPVTAPRNLHLSGGSASGEGRVTLTWEGQRAHLERLRVEGVTADYVRAPATAAAEARRLDTALALADALATRPIALRIDELTVHDSTFAYVSEMNDPDYRVAFTGAEVQLRDFDTDSDEPAHLVASGAVQGSGATRLEMRFPARWHDPAFRLALRMRDTAIPRFNDALRAFAGLDVASGRLSVDARLVLGEGRLNGTLRPAIENIDVHEPEQDADENILQQAYEGLVGTVTSLFESDEPEDAPEADFGVHAENVTTWATAVEAVRDASRHKLRTALQLALSDPLPPQR